MSEQSMIKIDYGNRAASAEDCAVAIREAALEQTALIVLVNDAPSNAVAVEGQKVLKGVLNSWEKARKEAKRPLIDLGREIEALCERETKELSDEYDRVCRLTADFAALENSKLLAAEAAARIERDAAALKTRQETERVERERREAQMKIDEAERKRLGQTKRMEA